MMMVLFFNLRYVQRQSTPKRAASYTDGSGFPSNASAIAKKAGLGCLISFHGRGFPRGIQEWSSETPQTVCFDNGSAKRKRQD